MFQSDASLIDNIWQSLKDLTVDISRLRSELGTSNGNQRSLQELQDELTTLQVT